MSFMSKTAFDTLKLARRLQAIGLPPAQADGFAEVFSEVMVTDLATKTDLAEVETRLRGEFRLECEKIRTEIAASRSEILRWIVPLILAQMALTVGVLLRMGG
jgi:hypothetical protein